ncbi:hypothetical protein L2E82_01129 [Cichorium intybus]|uniref:Uncharacterized protein n=1 Tax=Cichorium intybus TaxID=13427 RepID=A0ACB9H076_CICIN|nr:hypothetical protein L2E82_01129 [Cichorium intybus]
MFIVESFLIIISRVSSSTCETRVVYAKTRLWILAFPASVGYCFAYRRSGLQAPGENCKIFKYVNEGKDGKSQ